MDSVKTFLILLAISAPTLRYLVKRLRRLSLPPGPTGLPIIGNALEFTAEKHKEPTWIKYHNWSKIYGDVFTFSVLGSRTVVLNSYKAIVELLEHRSYNYSDRPRQPMFGELIGAVDWQFSVMGYTDSWRSHRKVFHQSFQSRMVPEYFDIQKDKVASLMRKLETSPKDFFHHFRAHSGGIVLEIIYGYRIQENLYADPYVKIANDGLVAVREAALHGSFLVDYIPILKYVPAWLPGASFRTKAKVWRRDTNRVRDTPWAELKQKMDNGTAIPCFSTRHLENVGKLSTSNDHLAEETIIRNCAALAFGAGTDTTVSAMLSFVLAMVLNPEIQAQAQKELDEVIGSRLPDFADRVNLPYISAILAETFRWNPVTPLALPHGAVNDDVYEGYLIPAGSTVVPNVWAIFHDESLYGPDTASFNPERFTKQDVEEPSPSPESIAFGFGRRACPGRHLAINTVWLTMTYLLSAFTMAKELDDEGKEIDPAVQYPEGVISHPLPFNCRFIPRSSAVFWITQGLSGV